MTAYTAHHRGPARPLKLLRDRRAWAVAIALCLLSLPARAGTSEGTTEGDSNRIFGGEAAQTCAWPTAVAVQNGGALCTGTLVHPEVVVFAAHCGASPGTRIRLGENLGNAQTVVPANCETNPNYAGVASDQANDWAYCKLSQPLDLPITPIAFGCETAALQPGAQVAIVGFGANQGQSGAGTKRWALTTMTSFNEAANTGTLGGNGQPSVCPGDSGGPSFVRLDDGTWRAWGIASTVIGGCGGAGTHSLMQGAMQWIEDATGVDLTPCHNTDGSWAPSPSCAGFYRAEPGVGMGSWSGSWCEGTPSGGPSKTCGPGFDAEPDEEPPTASISSPVYGQVFPELPAVTDILVDAEDAGWGIKEVRLEINGNDVGVADSLSPYAFEGATFPDAGLFEFVAVAEDHAGFVTRSLPVTIGVGDVEVPTEPEPPTDTGEVGTDGETGGEGGAGANGEAAGCSCSSATTSPIWSFALFGLLNLRRRRRARKA